MPQLDAYTVTFLTHISENLIIYLDANTRRDLPRSWRAIWCYLVCLHIQSQISELSSNVMVVTSNCSYSWHINLSITVMHSIQ